MKIILAFLITFSVTLMASDEKKKVDGQKARAQKQVEEQMKKEQKYAREQTFYQGQYYDFKGAEVNPDSVDSVPEIPVDDFDMDSVYD